MTQLSKLIFGDRAVTIYNKYVYVNPVNDRTITKWIRTVLPNCLRVGGVNIGYIGDIGISENSNRVQIPLFKEYKEPLEWSRLPNDEMTGMFTVQSGDTIVLNEVLDEIVDGLFSILDLETKYGTDCFKIKDVNHYYNDKHPLKFIEAVG